MKNTLAVTDIQSKLNDRGSSIGDDNTGSRTSVPSASSAFWANCKTEEWNEKAWDTSGETKEERKNLCSYAQVVQSVDASALQSRTVNFRGGRGRRGGGIGMSNLAVHSSLSRIRNSNCSLNSKGSVDSEGYTVVERKKRKNNKRNVIMGTSSKTNCAIKGAPEPNRDLFIFRLDPETTDESLKKYIVDNGISIKELELKSNAKAMFKSYRLRVPKSQFARLLDGNMWPEGVGIRKYFSPATDVENVKT